MTTLNCVRYLFLLSIAAVMAPAAGQIKRAYKSECGLKDGSKFLMRAPYTYYPLAIGHGSRTDSVGGWEVYYQGSRGGKSKSPATIQFADQDQADCSKVGKINDIPVVSNSYLKPNGVWLSPEIIPGKFSISQTRSEQPPHLRDRLAQLHAHPTGFHALVVPRKGRLIYEMALISFEDKSPDGKIVAVYQAISYDQGAHWSEPVITAEAEIYELGKSEKSQSFAAFPLTKK